MNKALILKLLKPTIKGLHVMVEGIGDTLKKSDPDPANDTTAEKVIKIMDGILGQLETALSILPI